MLSWLPVFLFFLGLCVGSFVNVLVFRFGFDERASKRSECMSCNGQLAWYDLVPVVSFFALRARCRNCGSRLSIQYPLVELAVACLFALSGALLPPTLSLWSCIAFVALLFFLAALVALVAYDIRHTLVPMPFVYALGAFGFAAAFSQSMAISSFLPLYDSALGAAALFGFFIAIVLVTRGRGMGAGDAYVAGAIGLLLGFTRGIEAAMIGVWAGTIVGLALLLLSSLGGKSALFRKKVRVTMKTELPLVPFLALGTVAALFTDFSPLQFAAGISNALFFGHP